MLFIQTKSGTFEIFKSAVFRCKVKSAELLLILQISKVISSEVLRRLGNQVRLGGEEVRLVRRLGSWLG